METAREYVLTRCSLKAVCGVIVASRKRYTSRQEALNAAGRADRRNGGKTLTFVDLAGYWTPEAIEARNRRFAW